MLDTVLGIWATSMSKTKNVCYCAKLDNKHF